MGNLFREYWLPALLSSELPAPDSDPVRVLLLGEKLIAFRDTNGTVGLMENNCPHRGASLFFGAQRGMRAAVRVSRLEVRARRHVHRHAQRASRIGLQTKVKAMAYPTRERGGMVWAYLGPRATPPPLPDLEGNMLPAGHGVGVPAVGELAADPRRPHRHGPRRIPALRRLKRRISRAVVLGVSAQGAPGALRGHRHRRRRRLRRVAPRGPGQTYWRIAQWLFPPFRWRRRACSGWPSATPSKCRWTTSTRSPTRCR